MLTDDDRRRYARHLSLPGFGDAGQEKLKAASVLVVGTGGLGSPASIYLCAAGIGRIGTIDFDVVDESNLQRQVIHSTADVGRSKVESAATHLAALNPHVQIDAHDVMLTSANAMQIIASYDVIVDASDNYPTRYLVNDACVLGGKPNVYGSIFQFEGQASVFSAARGPCYRCLYPQPPPPALVPNCNEGGVLGILPGLIGIIQATECVKLIAGVGTTLVGRLLLYDALTMQFRELAVRKNAACALCGEHRAISTLVDYQAFCGLGRYDEIEASQLRDKLDRREPLMLLDVREPSEHHHSRIEQAALIPLGELQLRLDEIRVGCEIIVHCASGARGRRAVDLLKQHGFNNVKNLAGGIAAWERAGQKLVTN